MLERRAVGSRALGFALCVVTAALFAACSGSSNSGDDDEDDDTDAGGSSGAGGVLGLGGGSSAGKGGATTGGTAGVGATGGTGSGQSACLSVCSRVQTCPDTTPVDCASDCQYLEAEAAAAGCTAVYTSFINCWNAASDVCSLETQGCDSQVLAYLDCMEGGGGTGCMPTGIPNNATCSGICARMEACPDASSTCVTSCTEAQTDAAALGCAPALQDYFDCVSSCGDVCALNETDCQLEINAYAACVGVSG